MFLFISFKSQKSETLNEWEGCQSQSFTLVGQVVAEADRDAVGNVYLGVKIDNYYIWLRIISHVHTEESDQVNFTKGK